MTNTVTYSMGTGFTGLLTLMFIAFKLAHVIDWNWFWVLSPIIFSLGLVLLILLLIGMGVGIYYLVKK